MAASAGIKRKSANGTSTDLKVKKAKVAEGRPKRDFVIPKKPSTKSKPAEESEELVESDTTEDDHGFYGFAAKEESERSSSEEENGSASDSISEADEKAKDVKKMKVDGKKTQSTAANGTKPTALESLNCM